MEELKREVQHLTSLLETAARWNQEHTPDKQHPVPIRTGVKELIKFGSVIVIQTIGLVAWTVHAWDGHDGRIANLENARIETKATLDIVSRLSGDTNVTVTRIDEHLKSVDSRIQRIEDRK